MKYFKPIFLIMIFMMLTVLPLSSLTIKLGSVAPSGSDWDLALKQMSNDWREITNGQVNVKIYSGGIAGNEDNMIQKMRIGQLDMAVLTAIGMNKIVPATFVLSLPFLLNDDDEVEYMLENITPSFDSDFRDKGFEVLIWSTTGWVRFFSKNIATTPDMLRTHKIGVSATESELMDAWKRLNFHVIPLGINDTLSGLQSGMIGAFYAPPMAAAAYQWFSMTPHMNAMPVSPLLGGIVISKRTWNRIPSRYHAELKDAVLKANAHFGRSSIEMNDEALDVMVRYGLEIDEVSEAERMEWKNLFDEDYSAMVGPGKLIPTDAFQLVKSKLEEFRTER